MAPIDAPLGFGLLVGLASSQPPAKRLPAHLRRERSAASSHSGVFFEPAESPLTASATARFGTLPEGVPDLTAVWDGTKTYEQAIEEEEAAADHTAEAGGVETEGARRSRLSDAGTGAEVCRAWGYNPLTHAIYETADPRRWGYQLVAFPPAKPGESVQPAGTELELTICVDLGASLLRTAR